MRSSARQRRAERFGIARAADRGNAPRYTPGMSRRRRKWRIVRAVGLSACAAVAVFYVLSTAYWIEWIAPDASWRAQVWGGALRVDWSGRAGTWGRHDMAAGQILRITELPAWTAFWWPPVRVWQPSATSGRAAFVQVMLWVPLGAGLLATAYAWFRGRAARRGCCDECGYDLRAIVGDRCPECGEKTVLSPCESASGEHAEPQRPAVAAQRRD